MIRPPEFCRSRTWDTARAISIAPRRFTRRMRSESTFGNVARIPAIAMAALLTRPWSLSDPPQATASLTKASTSAATPRSQLLHRKRSRYSACDAISWTNGVSLRMARGDPVVVGEHPTHHGLAEAAAAAGHDHVISGATARPSYPKRGSGSRRRPGSAAAPCRPEASPGRAEELEALRFRLVAFLQYDVGRENRAADRVGHAADPDFRDARARERETLRPPADTPSPRC